jgi:hypothetical protein
VTGVLHTDAKGAQLTIDGRRLTVVQRGECRDVAVTVDLPEDAGKRAEIAAVLSLPEPEVGPGTTGWATVRIAPFPARRNRGIVALNDDGDRWFFYVDQNSYSGQIAFDLVTDFVADPAPLTAEYVRQITTVIVDAMDRSDEVMTDLVQDALAPYVAKGGAGA